MHLGGDSRGGEERRMLSREMEKKEYSLPCSGRVWQRIMRSGLNKLRVPGDVVIPK